ncbi:MAG: hypothetical protein ACOCUE_01245 [Candidatus Izemoplasmataceae bacterium]
MTLIFLPNDYKIAIYSAKLSHQYIHTSELETIMFPILINQDDSLFMIKEAVIDSYIINQDTHEKVPVNIVSMKQTHEQLFKETTYFGYQIQAAIGIYSEDLAIDYHQAKLEIIYNDGVTLSIPIGAFYYHFVSLDTPHLFVYDRINLSSDTLGVSSSMGSLFSLENKSDYPIAIESIKLLSQTITPNMSLLSQLEVLDANKYKLEDYFSESAYLLPPSSNNKPVTLEAYEEAFFAIPFTYLDQDKLLHQYPLVITYTLEEERYTAIFDDFTFIKTNIFLGDNHAIYEAVTIDQN